MRTGIADAMRVASSTSHLLDRVRLFEVSLYSFCVKFIHRMRGLTMRIKMCVWGGRESPWIVPRRIWIRRLNP